MHPLVSTKASPTIEFLVNYLANNGTFEMVKNVSHWAQVAGAALTVTQLDSFEKREHCFRGIIDRNPLGVIAQTCALTQSERDSLRSRNIPLVMVGPISINGSSTTDLSRDMTVSVDGWRGALLATKHLISLGHSRIAMITGPMDLDSSIARLGGYSAAMTQAGLPVPPEQICEADFLPEKGYEAACTLLDRKERPTAIFTCNDLTALSVYRAADERGLAIGDDLSVVSFDDFFPSSYMSPALTTVHQPFDTAAQKAVCLIMTERRASVAERHIILPTRLFVRDSTKAHAAS